jgi:hypothetical protein
MNKFLMTHPNTDANSPRYYFPMRACRHVATEAKPFEDEPFSGAPVCFDPLFVPKDAVLDSDGECITASKYDHGNHWPIDEFEARVKKDIPAIEILEALQASNWDMNERRKLRSRLKLLLEATLLDLSIKEAAWLEEMKEAEPERYEFLRSRGNKIVYVDEQAKLHPSYAMKARRIFEYDLPVIAEWCMADFSSKRWTWGKVSPFKFPVETPATTTAAELASQPAPQAKPVAQAKPAEDPVTAAFRKLLATQRRKHGVDPEVSFILGNEDPK